MLKSMSNRRRNENVIVKFKNNEKLGWIEKTLEQNEFFILHNGQKMFETQNICFRLYYNFILLRSTKNFIIT